MRGKSGDDTDRDLSLPGSQGRDEESGLDRIRLETINGERAGHLAFCGLAETLAWRRTPKAYEWQR